MSKLKIRTLTSTLCLSLMMMAQGHADWCGCDCLEWNSNLDLIGGYRHDEIKSTVHSHNDGNFVGKDTVKFKDLQIGEVGLGGKVSVNQTWFLRGYATWGWVTDGKFTENSDVAGAEPIHSHGKVKDGQVFDGSIGLGYSFCVTDCFSVAPVVGYAYDYEKIKLKNDVSDSSSSSSSSFEGSDVLNGLTYKQRWQGPFLGVDALFTYCDFNFDLGYEYHWANWHADWRLAGPDEQGVAFSDTRHAKCGYGNVVFLNANYEFCDCWEVGLGFKYQYWKANGGKARGGHFDSSSSTSEDSDYAQRHKATSTWQPWEVTVRLGYNF